MEQHRLPVFSERFSKLRGEKTQDEFAKFLGISRPTVGFYENGTRLPDALVLRQIAERCNVSVDYLLGLSDYKDTKTAHSTAENIGLTENAAAILAMENKSENHSKLIILNYLIENLPFLDYLTKYFASSFESLAREKPYALIPYDRREIRFASRLPFADIIERLPKYKNDFYNDVVSGSEHNIEQMILALIKTCANDDLIVEMIALLRDSDCIDDQLKMIAKFLAYLGQSDFANRADCRLERCFERMDNENGVTETKND